MLSFIGACVLIALMVMFGGFILNLLMVAAGLVVAGIAWLIEEIKKP